MSNKRYISMAKNSTTGNSQKTEASCAKPQAKAPADKHAKRDVKPSKPGKKDK
jgi:hypothetical protein